MSATAGELLSGQIVPGTQYRVMRLLGAGGHGSVYEVEHTFLEARAVMKVLHGDLTQEGDLAERMTREARTLAKLRHPNIVEVRDGGLTAERPPRPFFVMEPLNGMPLRALLRQVPNGLGVVQSLNIAIGMLGGLHYAHQAGVVHRDIKPDNVFLHKGPHDHASVPKLLDFGIAHLVLGRRLTGRYFLGTPRYASPEQLRSEELSACTDIYAVGLCLYEMLTGEAPYASRKDIAAIMNAHLNEALPPIAGRLAAAPPALDKFLGQMLHKDPAKRPPTAFAAAVGLRELRSIVEALQTGSIHAPDFKTEPTPMENVLTEASPDELPIVTEVGPMSGPNDTMPDAPPLFVTKPLAAAKLEVAPTEPAQRDGAPAPASGVDRHARTRTARPHPQRRTSANDTEVDPVENPTGAIDPSPRSAIATASLTPTGRTTSGLSISQSRPSPRLASSRAKVRTFLPLGIAVVIASITVGGALVIRRGGTAAPSNAVSVASATGAVPSSASTAPLPSSSASPVFPSEPSPSARASSSTSTAIGSTTPPAALRPAPADRTRSPATSAPSRAPAKPLDPANVGF